MALWAHGLLSKMLKWVSGIMWISIWILWLLKVVYYQLSKLVQINVLNKHVPFQAVERDKGKKGKISKKRKKGKKGSKKGKKKKDKDLTPDRTTESLFEELVMNNVIKPYPKVNLICSLLRNTAFWALFVDTYFDSSLLICKSKPIWWLSFSPAGEP